MTINEQSAANYHYIQTAARQIKNECCQKMQHQQEQLVRVNADFDNFKKRVQKEKQQWIASGQSVIFLDLLAIVDDFDRALEAQKMQKDIVQESCIQGFELIRAQLYKLLEKYKVQEITEVTHFDPLLHEAVMQVEQPGYESGAIVQVLQKGFMFNDMVLRPAKVSVAK